MDVTPVSSVVPDQEYFLQGSILETSRDVLLHRLRGLCDNLETGPETFDDHEMVYSMSMRGTGQQVLFRARRSLSHLDVPWHLRYVGQPEMGDKTRPTLLRSCIDVSTSDNLKQFLVELGFKLEYEYVVKGYLFTKGRMKITVSKVFRMLEASNTETIEPLSQSYLVELSVVTTSGQEQVQEEMKNFAEQLKPLVQLEKIDHRQFQQK